MLFDDICREVLEHRRVQYRKKTYLAAKNQIAHLLRTFAGRDVATMNQTSWAEHAIRAKTEHPDRNLNDDRKYFLIIMRAAFLKGLISAPVVSLPKPDLENEVGRELSDDEIERLFAASDSELRLLIETALRLGWRKNSEMLACRWAWFDWTAGTIRLPAASTKTKRSRIVPVPKDLLDRLAARYRASRSPLVFHSPWELDLPMYIEKMWRSAKKRAHVQARWHDLRHTCATRMVRAGVPIPNISRVLGMGPRVLMRIYAHTNLEDSRLAVESVRIPRAI